MTKKCELQDKAMKILMDSATNDPLKPKFKELLKTLLANKSSLFVLLDCMQKRNQMQFSIQIFDILAGHFAKSQFNEEDSQRIANSFISIINSELPSNINKLDINTINYLQSSASAAQYFSSYFKNVETTNQYVLTFLIFIYVFTHNSVLKDKVMPIMNQKLIYNVTSLAILRSLPNSELTEQPTVRALSSVFKSSCDNNLGDYTIPIILSCLPHYINETSSKECAAMIPLILKKLKRDNNNMIQFSRFLFPLFEFNETFTVVKAASEDILQAYITTVNDNSQINSPAELSDPLTYVNNQVASSFIKLCAALSVNIGLLFQTKTISYPTGVLLLSIYVARMISINEFDRCDREAMIGDLLSVCPKSSSNFHLLIILSGYFVVGFNSKRGLEVLVEGLQMNSRQACNWMVSDEMPYDTVFPVLATNFDADKSCELYLHTLISLIKSNVPQIPDEMPFDDSVTAYSDSNFEFIYGLNKFDSDTMDISDLQGVPTPSTTLFCHVITKYVNHPELGPLLPLSAATVSQQFAIDLTKNMKQQKRKRSKMELIASYSNALTSLDLQTLHSLAQTFLLLSPGVSMLFLAVSLQRLPSEAIKRMMQKTSVFATTNPESFAKMIALVAHSHPELALNFMDTYTEQNINKRRVFFFLRSNPDDNEQSYTAAFQSIGYFCNFVDNGFFINDFLPFATRFLNKHLTHQSKSYQFNSAQLNAIRRISLRLVKYQDDHHDHIFPFKDFLVQFVCSLFMDVGDSILTGTSPTNQPNNQTTTNKSNKTNTNIVVIILQTLTSLLPIHPIRINDKHDRSLELIVLILQNVTGDEFNSIFKAASAFILELLRTNPTVLVLNSILGPIFQNILNTKEWRPICNLLSLITSQWESVKIVQGGPYLSQLVTSICPMLTNILPLLPSDMGNIAINCVENLCSLQCAIRNQILSLPRSIRPPMPSTEFADSDERCHIGCQFTSKNLLTSQVFDIIKGLLEIVTNDKSLEEHTRGCILAATFLLQERGNEEFRDDAKIVSLLAKSLHKSDKILDISLRTFKVLSGMRFFSVVSSLIANKSEVEPFASKIITSLLENDNSEVQLLTVVCDMSCDESQENSWFTTAAYPLLGKAVKESSDEQWAKIFMGVAKHTKDSNSPLFTSLFGFNNMTEILENAEEERPLVFTMITSLLPEGFSPYFSLLSLELAAASVENCNALLSYFFTDLRIADDKTFEHLIVILKKHPFESWREQANYLAILIADNVFSSQTAMKCAHAYIDSCDDDSLTFIWSSIISHVISDFDRWLSLIDELSYRVDAVSFGPIIPLLVVHAKNSVCAKVLSLIAERVCRGGNEDVVSKVLKSDVYKQSDLISEFSSMLKRGDHCAESVAALAILCENVVDSNIYAVEAIIDEAIRMDGNEDNCAISVLQGLLL